MQPATEYVRTAHKVLKLIYFHFSSFAEEPRLKDFNCRAVIDCVFEKASWCRIQNLHSKDILSLLGF